MGAEDGQDEENILKVTGMNAVLGWVIATIAFLRWGKDHRFEGKIRSFQLSLHYQFRCF